jgi:hypothetical protein
MGFFVINPLEFSIGCFAFYINAFFPFVVHDQKKCLESNLLQFIEGQPHFSTSWNARMSLTLNELIYRMCIVQTSRLPPSMHQALTKEVVCKQPNANQKFH